MLPHGEVQETAVVRACTLYQTFYCGKPNGLAIISVFFLMFLSLIMASLSFIGLCNLRSTVLWPCLGVAPAGAAD